MEPNITVDEAKALVRDNAKAPKVTEESIKDHIKDVKYIYDGTFTICIITMVNGYKSIGHSAPVSEANYMKDVGDRYAYESAFKPLWQLEAYVKLWKRMEAENGSG